MSNKESPNFDNVHWADNSAQRVLNEFPNEKIYNVASGITPSGIVHVGHFREIITTELVRRALVKKGKKTNFIYSWDSYDAFRKVPKNIPEEWDKYLRLSNAAVPDPWGCHESFAEHFMQEAEESLEVFKFPIQFQRQHLLQTSGIYADGIKKALNEKEKVRVILDKYRKEPLNENWFPLSVFCEKCGKDTTNVSNYDKEYSLDYVCNCGFKNRINFKKTHIVKLSWRLDWPMRWDFYNITFEPSGKDHASTGGSWTTGKEIVKEVFGVSGPVDTFYTNIAMKGQGGKVSSSSGNGATIPDVLKIYTPELVLFLFAGTRPNAEFEISFDLDVIKIYEDFDKLERLYYGLEEEKNAKKLATYKRIYELSMVGDSEVQKTIPFQPSFRHLSTVIQSNNFNFEKVNFFYKNEIKTVYDLNRLKDRFECAKNWLENYAPEDMVFKFQESIDMEFLESEKKSLTDLRDAVNKYKDSKDLMSEFKIICENNSIEVKNFFKLAYTVIISKEKGPRLPNLILENKDKVLNLLNQIK
ncbi:MAG: lysine--tRNA ligase [Candidatus Woesearchaeota archaeon]|jgi:lysyl-tRNA synthetase class 1|nr:lysine--tRNA ligase [Candidatus Woesearchaeota archaeon]